MQYHYIETPVGRLLGVAQDAVILGLYWEVFSRTPSIGPDWTEDETPFRRVMQQLNEYFTGKRVTFDSLPIPMGTPFQQAVWQQIARIPHGESISYADIAKTISRPNAVRAVGTAVGSNPLSIIIPCHRVLTSTGKIGGYAGGIEAKKQLLALENILLKS